jgi:hypothetical protein
MAHRMAMADGVFSFVAWLGDAFGRIARWAIPGSRLPTWFTVPPIYSLRYWGEMLRRGKAAPLQAVGLRSACVP